MYNLNIHSFNLNRPRLNLNIHSFNLNRPRLNLNILRFNFKKYKIELRYTPNFNLEIPLQDRALSNVDELRFTTHHIYHTSQYKLQAVIVKTQKMFTNKNNVKIKVLVQKPCLKLTERSNIEYATQRTNQIPF